LSRFVYGLSRVMTLSDVAELTLLSWDTVKTIVKTHLAKDYGKPFLKGVRYLGIDEIHVGKKGRFYTIVIDLEDGRILWAKPGRGGAALRGFWRRLRLAKAKIRAVATDMSAAYWSAVLEHLPDAALVAATTKHGTFSPDRPDRPDHLLIWKTVSGSTALTRWTHVDNWPRI